MKKQFRNYTVEEKQNSTWLDVKKDGVFLVCVPDEDIACAVIRRELKIKDEHIELEVAEE